MGILPVLILFACSKKEPELWDDITDLYPIRRLINETEVIAEGSVESFDSKTRKAMIKFRPALLGQVPADRVEIDLSGGGPTATDTVTRHFVPGSPVVWFSAGGSAVIYVNRFFSLCYGGAGKWVYVYVETRLNRTYSGAVQDLSPLVQRLLDGSVPAPLIDPDLKPISIADLKTLPVWGEPVEEDYLPKCFRKGKPPAAELRAPENPAGLLPGLRWSQLEGGEQGLSEALSLAGLPASKDLDVRFRGHLEVPKDGGYVFTLRGNGKITAILELGGIEVFRTGDAARDYIGDVSLKAGRHAIRLNVKSSEKERTLEVLWAGPGFTRRSIPPASLYHLPQ
jgi:hypothetical protein